MIGVQFQQWPTDERIMRLAIPVTEQRLGGTAREARLSSVRLSSVRLSSARPIETPYRELVPLPRSHLFSLMLVSLFDFCWDR
jgi:hypothetical protein